ncbi:MAG: glycoside hydrolase family 28 protein [Lachnospiraceae bacterium]|nr:glycoside hydrolase family 28 protein [Lachnospiraceae bacterium]
MYNINYYKYFVTDKSITLYWDKPDNASKNIIYKVYIDGELVLETNKTHCTIDNLNDSHEYCVKVDIVEAGEYISSLEYGVIGTAQKKNRKDITKAPYNAVGNGVTLNTKVLQQAIDDCTIEDVLYIPAGIFKTGALKLHSDMEIYLEEGAVLQGTSCVEDYLPRIPSRFEGTELSCYSSVLNMGDLDHAGGYNCKNIFIHGKGTIASGGKELALAVIESERERLKDYLEELGDKIKEYQNSRTIPGRVRPRLVNMSNCQNVILSGLTFSNGASWNVHMIYSDNIVTHNCVFTSEEVWNGDGWDPDSSTNCTIFATTFYTGDDSIAIKSGKNPEGNIINRPCEHIRVFDCVSKFGHGVTVGSEMSGGINDVKIWDCDFENSWFGLEIKATKKRGGYVRNVNVKDCKLPRVMFHSVGYNDDGISAGVAPIFEKCIFERLSLSGAYFSKQREWCECSAIELCGFDEPGHEIKDITFRDIKIGSDKLPKEQTLSLRLCENITFERISCL